MDLLLSETDIVIIGAGPAGCASAIQCLKKNLKVTIIENKSFPRYRPGETLHPGVSVLINKLGIESEFEKLSSFRHLGILFQKGEKSWFSKYGQDTRGDWKGYQIQRSDLDQILLDKAIQLGAKVLQPCKALNVIKKESSVIGIQTSEGPIFAKYVIDSSGSNHWLQKKLNLDLKIMSKPLFAKFGYFEGNLGAAFSEPTFKIENDGWFWGARVSHNTYHWTRLFTHKKFTEFHFPKEFTDLKIKGKVRAAEVTWRYVQECAGQGYFITGDSSLVFDPSAAKGVLYALYSGIMASEYIANETLHEGQKIELYKKWVKNWFFHNLKTMREIYLGNEL
jgi:flavin-dependent dehydrogenase